MNKIVLIGPESTGKSTLCKLIAEHFDYALVSEYAREYVENLKRKYTYSDVEQIALHQKSQFLNCRENCVFDTDIIITKVWFEIVYGHMPQWINDAIKEEQVSLYLLCKPDIIWVPDATRENGDCREQLYQRYKQEIITTKIPFVEIKGNGEERIKNAIDAVSNNIR